MGQGAFLRRVSVAAATVVCAAGFAASAAGAAEFDVDWTLAGAVAAQAQQADGDPPGANDWDCKPSKAHPDPVVLAHGLIANKTVNWNAISPFLANRGFCVYALTYGTKDDFATPLYQPGGLTTMQKSARELKRFIKRVRRSTGAEKVDIVGHSEGSIMPSWYVRFLGGGRVVDDYVGMTPLWEGTNPAGLSTLNDFAIAFGLDPALVPTIDRVCSSCRQFLKGSRFFARLHARGTTSKRVQYTSILTKYDELVVPYKSGLLPKAPNVTNVVLQDYCALDAAEHGGVMVDPVTAGFVYRALDPERAPKPPCVPVTPLGALGYEGD